MRREEFVSFYLPITTTKRDEKRINFIIIHLFSSQNSPAKNLFSKFSGRRIHESLSLFDTDFVSRFLVKVGVEKQHKKLFVQHKNVFHHCIKYLVSKKEKFPPRIWVSSDDDKKQKFVLSAAQMRHSRCFQDEVERHRLIESWSSEKKQKQIKSSWVRAGMECVGERKRSLMNKNRIFAIKHFQFEWRSEGTELEMTWKLFISYQIPSGIEFFWITSASFFAIVLVIRPLTKDIKTFFVISINVMYVYAVCINPLCISSYLIECFIIKDIVIWLLA